MPGRGTASPCWGVLCGWGVLSVVSPSLCCSRSPARPVSVAHREGGAQSPPPLLCAEAPQSPGALYLGRAPYNIHGASPGSRGLCCLYNQGQSSSAASLSSSLKDGEGRAWVLREEPLILRCPLQLWSHGGHFFPSVLPDLLVLVLRCPPHTLPSLHSPALITLLGAAAGAAHPAGRVCASPMECCCAIIPHHNPSPGGRGAFCSPGEG